MSDRQEQRMVEVEQEVRVWTCDGCGVEEVTGESQFGFGMYSHPEGWYGGGPVSNGPIVGEYFDYCPQCGSERFTRRQTYGIVGER